MGIFGEIYNALKLQLENCSLRLKTDLAAKSLGLLKSLTMSSQIYAALELSEVGYDLQNVLLNHQDRNATLFQVL